MKQLSFILAFLAIAAVSFGQSRYYMRYDSVYFERVGGNSEFILRNSTRDSTKGIAVNVGRGRLSYLKTKMIDSNRVQVGMDTITLVRTQVLNDSTFVINGDTITIGGTLQNIQGAINTGNHITDANDTIVVNDGNTFTIHGGNSTAGANVHIKASSSASNSAVSVVPSGINILHRNLSNGFYKGFQMSSIASSGISVLDQTDQTGLGYSANYKTNGITNFGNRWIPDWGAVNDAISDSLESAGGGLQETMIRGNTTTRQYIFDTTGAATPGSPATFTMFKLKPLDRNGKWGDFNLTTAAHAYTGVGTRDKVINMCWNCTPGMGQELPGISFGGFSLEHYFIPSVGDTINGEYHLVHGNENGTSVRLLSATVRENIGSYDLYHTSGRFYGKVPLTDRVYWNVQPSATGAKLGLYLSETKGYEQEYDTLNNLVYANASGLTNGEYRFGGFAQVTMPTMSVASEIRITDGTTVRSETNNTTHLGDASRRWMTVWGVDGNYNGILSGVRLKAGTGGQIMGSAQLNVSYHGTGGADVSIENNATTGTPYERVVLLEDLGSGHYGELLRYNNNVGSSQPGTSVLHSGMVSISNYSSNQTSTKPLLLTAGQIIVVPGSTSTNIGTRQDARGFRISRNSTLHTDNAYGFDLNANAHSSLDSVDLVTDKSTITIGGYNSSGVWVRIHPDSLAGSSSSDGNGIYGGNGSLPFDVTVSGGTNNLLVTSARAGALSTMTVSNTSSGHGLVVNGGSAGYGVYTSGFKGVYGVGTTGTGVHGVATSGVGLTGDATTGTALTLNQTPSTSNAIVDEATVSIFTSGNSGFGQDGFGPGFSYAAPTTTSTAANVMGRFAFRWSTATHASRTGEYIIQLVNNGGGYSDRFIVKGAGGIQLPAYTGSVTGTSTHSIASDASGNLTQEVLPKHYQCLLTQSGTAAPTATVLGTNSIGAIVWTRSSAGVYVATLTSAFPASKVLLFTGFSDESAGANILYRLKRTGDNTLELWCSPDGINAGDVFTNLSIKVEVYP